MSALSGSRTDSEQSLVDYYDHELSLNKIRIKTKERMKRSLMYHVRAIPTTLILDDNGNELKRMVGVMREDTLRASIEKLLGLRKSLLSRIFGRKNKSKIKSEKANLTRYIGRNEQTNIREVAKN